MGFFSSITKGIGGVLGLNSPDTGGMERAARSSNAIQKKMYEDSVNRSQPYQNLGDSAVNQLGEYMGTSGDPTSSVYGSLLQPYSGDALTNDPSYQFRLDQGQLGMERALAAQGKTMSPEAVKALGDYNQSMASTEYGNAFDRNRQSQGDIYNRLMGTTGIGQNANAVTSGLGQNYATNVGNTTTSLATQQAAAGDAASARRSSMFGNLAGGFLGSDKLMGKFF